MTKRFTIKTGREGLYPITAQVEAALAESEAQEGLCVVFCPHTTAGITINENADPDVRADLLLGLSKAFPDRTEFRHAEGNSSAHLKATCVGSSVSIIISQGRLLLGTWQGVYFCEFDGPRTRAFFVEVLPFHEKPIK
ncbi:MAG: secondary thiamine-phosphate synthase enzyme YjbQ [Treponema sp.]|jgi:secondary thiamine-phosphate synthase enzyme|nr:secondary thiamine-phosphate synthase enzyme YjbQ [Treponema sp.]